MVIKNITTTKLLKFFVCVWVITLCDSCETYFDSEAAVVTIKDEGVISDTDIDDGVLTDADLIFGIFPETETPYVYLTPEKELIVSTDHNLNGEIDGVYFAVAEENVFIRIAESIDLPSSVSTSSGEFLFFDYNDDLTLATMTYINADNVTKIYNNIPIQEIWDHDLNPSISNKSIYKKDENYKSVQLGLDLSAFYISAIACIAGVYSLPATFGLTAALTGAACFSAGFNSVKALNSIMVSAGDEPIINPKSLNTIEDGLFVADVLSCPKDAFSCLSAASGSELGKDLQRDFFQRISELANTDFIPTHYGVMRYSFEGTDDNCGCNGSTLTLDFGNGDLRNIVIGSSARIVLKEGTYEITLRNSNGSTGSQTLEVNSDNFLLSWVCFCNSSSGKVSKVQIKSIKKLD